jgi:hypothetical protein
MTAENRWLFDIADILQVHIVCSKCKATLSVAPGKWQRLPPTCVNCGEQLYLGNTPEERALERFKSAIDDLQQVGTERFRIRLEFNGPHAQSVSGN